MEIGESMDSIPIPNLDNGSFSEYKHTGQDIGEMKHLYKKHISITKVKHLFAQLPSSKVQKELHAICYFSYFKFINENGSK